MAAEKTKKGNGMNNKTTGISADSIKTWLAILVIVVSAIFSISAVAEQSEDNTISIGDHEMRVRTMEEVQIELKVNTENMADDLAEIKQLIIKALENDEDN